MPAYSSDEDTLDGVEGNDSYNAKALARKLSTFDDRFGSNDLTATTASSVSNNNSAPDLHDSDGSLYFDDEADKKKKKPARKGEPSFNQGGALEMLMTPTPNKKASVSATMMLPKSMAKSRKNSESNMSSKVASTLDKLGGDNASKKVPSKGSGKEKGNVNAMWDRLGKESGHGGSPKHRRSRSNPIPDLSDECGFIVEAGAPEALGSSSHRGGGGGEIPRSSRRGGRRGKLGESGHQKSEGSLGQLTQSPAARKRASRRRRDMDQGSAHAKNSLRSSSHGPGDRIGSSSHGPGDRSPATPRAMRRAVGSPTTPRTDMMSQSAHVSSDTPSRRRMRRRGSGSMGPSIDMPFSSPENGGKESVAATDLLTPSKQVMRGRRPGGRGGELGSSQHGGGTPRRSGSLRTSQHGGGGVPRRSGSLRTSQHGAGEPQRGGRRRTRSRDPALRNAEVMQQR